MFLSYRTEIREVVEGKFHLLRREIVIPIVSGRYPFILIVVYNAAEIINLTIVNADIVIKDQTE